MKYIIYDINVNKEELIKALKYDRDQYEKGYDDGYDEGFNADKWIPCSDKLPEKDGFYNVTVKFWHLNNPTTMSSHFENGKWTCVALDEKDVVIAWQPLPEPYVEEGEVDE